jgi:hypothetical protein
VAADPMRLRIVLPDSGMRQRVGKKLPALVHQHRLNLERRSAFPAEKLDIAQAHLQRMAARIASRTDARSAYFVLKCGLLLVLGRVIDHALRLRQRLSKFVYRARSYVHHTAPLTSR